MSANILEKANIAKLSKSNDTRAYIHLFFRVLLQLFFIFGLYIAIELNNTILILLMALLNGCIWSFWGYAGIGHEFFHNRVFSNKKTNRFWYNICSILIWSNPKFFKLTHLKHHNDTFSLTDTETNQTPSSGFIFLIFYSTINIPQILRRLFYTIVNALGYIPSSKNNSILIKKDMEGLQFWALAILTTHLTLLFISCFFINILFGLLIFLAPFTCQILVVLLSISQHTGLEEYKDSCPLLYSRTIILPSLISWLYAGMNYHCEHHLYPSVPYYNLPYINKALKEKSIKFNEVKFIYLWYLLEKLAFKK